MHMYRSEYQTWAKLKLHDRVKNVLAMGQMPRKVKFKSSPDLTGLFIGNMGKALPIT